MVRASGEFTIGGVHAYQVQRPSGHRHRDAEESRTQPPYACVCNDFCRRPVSGCRTYSGLGPGSVVRRESEAGVLQRGARRSRAGMAAANALRGGVAQRHRCDESGARSRVRHGDPEARRQCDRCRGRSGCRAEPHRADEHRRRRGRLRGRLHREGEQASLPERKRDCADRRDAAALQLRSAISGIRQTSRSVRACRAESCR